jgi:hypothetical protein
MHFTNTYHQGFDYGMSTSIQQGISTWHGALLNDNSTWRPYFNYGISPRCFFGEKQKSKREIVCVANDAIFEGA